MAEEKKTGNGSFTNIIVLLVIWVAIFSLLLENKGIRKFILSPFNSAQVNTYNDVVSVVDKNGAIKQINFYSSSKVDVNDVIQSLNNPYLFYAGTSNGIYASNDAGTTWRKIDFPKDINNSMAVERIFTNQNRPYEISFLVFDVDRAMIYTTVDNFFSIRKSYEINKESLKSVIGDRNISTIIPAGNSFIIGTKK